MTDFNNKNLLKALYQLTQQLGSENESLPVVDIHLRNNTIIRGVVIELIISHSSYNENIIIKEYGYPGYTSEENNLVFIATSEIIAIRIKDKDFQKLTTYTVYDPPNTSLTKLDLKRLVANTETNISATMDNKINIKINLDTLPDVKNAYWYIERLLKNLDHVFQFLSKDKSFQKEIDTIQLNFNSSDKNKLEDKTLNLFIDIPIIIQDEEHQKMLIESIKKLT